MERKIILSAVIICISAYSAFCQTARSIENTGLDNISIIEMGVNNDVWVGTVSTGVSYYNGSGWASFTGILNDSVTSIAIGMVAGQEEVFIGTTNGVAYKVGAGNFTTIPAMNGHRITGLSMTGSKNLWVSTLDSGAFVFDSTLTVVNAYNTGNSPIPFDHLRAMQLGGQGCMGYGAGTPDSGAFFNNSGNGSGYTRIDTSGPHSKLVDNRVNVMYRDNSCGRYLIGTLGGLSLCPDSMPCQNFTTANGLPENEVTSISQDCHGAIWIGTRDSGVAIFNNPSFTRLTTANGLTNNRIISISFAGPNCMGYVAMGDTNLALVDTSGVVVQIVNGIQNINGSKFNVGVYPQPASGTVNFVFGETLASGNMNLTDISGRTVQTVSIRNTTSIAADVSSLSAGLYFYQIMSDGQAPKTGKVEVMR